MNFKNKVIVALDTKNLPESEKLIKRIKKHIFGVKIGYEFFLNFGISGYQKIKKHKINIFLDLKMHDIPNTIEGGLQAISSLNPYFTTIHISGGDKMMEAATKNKNKTKILGVSILTSLNDKQIQKYYFKNRVNLVIEKYVKYAIDKKLDGIVCSPHEIKIVKKIAGEKLIIVTPGIRPDTYSKKDDQKRFMTPKKAIELGANYLVIGRPITKSKDPLKEIILINSSID